MKTALSIVLAGLLVTLPLKQVLAQAAEQEAATVQQTAPPDSSGHRLIRVPPVTDNTSRLWEPLAGKDAIADIFAYDGSETRVPVPRDIPVVAKVALVVVGIAAILLLLLVLACSGEGIQDIC